MDANPPRVDGPEDNLDDCGACNHSLDNHEAVAIGDSGSFICWETDCTCNIKMSARLIRAAAERSGS